MSTTDPVQSLLALVRSESQPEILKKPVQAIHMAVTGGIQNKTQRLGWNAMLKHAHDLHAKNPDLSVDVYSISRVQLMAMIGYTSPNRKHFKETLTQMQDLKVQWDMLNQDGNALWASCVLMPYIAFDRDKVYYSYASHLKPLLFGPKTYANLDLRIQRSFNLDCAAALYEWVNRFRDNPSELTNEMTWQEWRWVIYGATDEKSFLSEYKVFKREKLRSAIKEINERSDLEISLIENKDGGRSVKYLQFTVTQKAKFGSTAIELSPSVELDKRLEDIGVTARDRKKILSLYSVEVIEAHYRYTVTRINDKKQAALKSVGAYLKHALENGYALDLVVEPEEPPSAPDAALDIYADFVAVRNADAAALFNEQDIDAQNQIIREYNDLQTLEGMRVPDDASKRTKRYMNPMFGWYAMKTWGTPTTQEVVEHALKTGSLVLNKPSAK